MIQGSLSRRYARALLALGIEEDRIESLRKDLHIFSKLLSEHANLFQALCNHTLSLRERRNLLKEILHQLKIHHVTKNFLMLIMEKQRIHLFLEMEREFGELADQQKGLIQAKVSCAHHLPEKTKKEIIQQLERITGKEIKLRVQEKPDLVGGLVTQIGHTIFDGSVATQVEKLKKQLLQQKGL